MDMATECFGCGDIDEASSSRISLRAVMSAIAALAIAFVLMYVETWAIEEAPTWLSAAIVESVTMEGATGRSVATKRKDAAQSVLPDTAVPLAALH